MRTKALLLTAALGVAGAATSMAQVYSVNAVGYINLNLPQGFSLIANQLIQPSTTLSSLLPAPVLGTTVYKFDGMGYSLSTFDELDGIWLPNGNETIGLGQGVWINSPSAQTITFVGEVPTGTLTTPTPTGFSIVSSQVPQAGTVSALGLVPGPGDSIYKFSNVTGYSLFTFDELDSVWLPSEPSISVGEAFWLNRVVGSPATWARSFSL